MAIIAVAGMLTVLSLWQFASQATSSFGWLLHLASLALLVAACFAIDRGKTTEDKGQPWARAELGIALAIVCVAVFMRLYRLEQLPFGTWYDEADNGLHALSILERGNNWPLYIKSTNLPAHYVYLIALSFRLFEVSTEGIRLVSVALGLATVAAAYLAGRELFNRRMGLVLAFLVAVSSWDVNFSRIGMHGVSTPLFELVAVGFLLRAMRRQRFTDFTWAGLALGLGLCFYAAFRLFPIVVLLFLLHQTVVNRGFLRRSWGGLIICTLATLIVVAPIAHFSLRQPEVFWDRTRVTSVFAKKTTEEGWRAVRENTFKHLLMFNYRGDRNGRHSLPGKPMLDPVTGALMVLGFGLCIWRARHPTSLLIPMWLLVMLCTGIFSLDFEAPQSLRSIGSLPAAYILAIVPLDGLWRAWERGLRPGIAGHFVWPLLLLLAYVGYSNYYVYFERKAKDFASWNAFSTAETITGQILAQSSDSVEFHVVSLYCNHPTVRFIARNATQYHRFETNSSLPILRPANRDIVLILDPERRAVYQDAQRYYPQAVYKEHRPPFGGPPVLYSVRLRQSDIASIQGLMGTYYPGDDWTGEPALQHQDASLCFDWRDGAPLALPCSAEWGGFLRTDHYGCHRLTLRAPGRAELRLDEKLILEGEGELSADVILAKGNHALYLRAAGAEGHFELAWQPPGENEQTVPSSALYVPPVTSNGLLGKYYPNSDWWPPEALAQVDPQLNLYFHVTPLPRPYTVEWEGKILIPQDGEYAFGLESIDESILYIDEQRVTESLLPNHYQQGAIALEKGLHDIRLRFADRTSYTHVNLYWIPPGGRIRQPVPTDILFPPLGELSAMSTPCEAGPAPTSTLSGVVDANLIQLSKDWNLISVPSALQDPSVSAVFAQAPNVTTVSTWQDGERISATRGGSGWSGELTQIVDGKGYLVHASEPTALALHLRPSDSSSAPAYSMPAGWSMIGFTSSAPSMPVDTYLSSLKGEWTTLYRYDGAKGWELAKPNGVGFIEMERGRGYRIYLTSRGTLKP
ncbi:MAG: PA14 domain-containing protein [Chloroflexota bacterium]